MTARKICQNPAIYHTSRVRIWKQTTLAASEVKASRTTPRQSYRTRIRRNPLIQLIVCSTTNRTLPRPAALQRVPLGDLRPDAEPTLDRPGQFVVVAPVGVEFVGEFLGAAGLAADLGEIFWSRRYPAEYMVSKDHAIDDRGAEVELGRRA